MIHLVDVDNSNWRTPLKVLALLKQNVMKMKLLWS